MISCQKNNLNVRNMKLLKVHDINYDYDGMWVMILLVLWISKHFLIKIEEKRDHVGWSLLGMCFALNLGENGFHSTTLKADLSIGPPTCFCTAQELRKVLYFLIAVIYQKKSIICDIWHVYEIQIQCPKIKFFGTYLCLSIYVFSMAVLHDNGRVEELWDRQYVLQSLNICYLALYKKVCICVSEGTYGSAPWTAFLCRLLPCRWREYCPIWDVTDGNPRLRGARALAKAK